MDEYDPESPTDDRENNQNQNIPEDPAPKLPSILDIPIAERWTPLDKSVIDEPGYKKSKKKKKKKKKVDEFAEGGEEEIPVQEFEPVVDGFSAERRLSEIGPVVDDFGGERVYNERGNFDDGFGDGHGFGDRQGGYSERQGDERRDFQERRGRGGDRRGSGREGKDGPGNNKQEFGDQRSFEDMRRMDDMLNFDNSLVHGNERGDFDRVGNGRGRQSHFNDKRRASFDGRQGFHRRRSHSDFDNYEESPEFNHPEFDEFEGSNEGHNNFEGTNQHGFEGHGPFDGNHGYEGHPSDNIPPQLMDIQPNLSGQQLPFSPGFQQPYVAGPVPSGPPVPPGPSQMNFIPPGYNGPQPPVDPNVSLSTALPPSFQGLPPDAIQFMQHHVMLQQQAMLAKQQQPSMLAPQQQLLSGQMPVVSPAENIQQPIEAPPQYHLQPVAHASQQVILEQIQLPPPPPENTGSQKKKKKKGRSKPVEAAPPPPPTPPPMKGTGDEPIEIDDSPPPVVVIDDHEDTITIPESEAKEEEKPPVEMEEQEEPSAARKLLNRVLQATKTGEKTLRDLNQLPPMIGKGLINVKKAAVKTKISFQVKPTSKTVEGSGGESDDETKVDMSLRPKIVKKTDIFKPDEDVKDPTVQHLVKIRDDLELQDKIQKEEFKVVLAALSHQAPIKEPSLRVKEFAKKIEEQHNLLRKSRWSESTEETSENTRHEEKERNDNTNEDVDAKSSKDDEEKENGSHSRDGKRLSEDRSKRSKQSGDRSHSRDKSREKHISKSKDKSPDRNRDRSRDKSREKSRNRDRSGDRNKDRSRERRRDRSREKSRDKSRTSRERHSRRSRSRSGEKPVRHRSRSDEVPRRPRKPFSPGKYYSDDRGYYWSASDTPWYKFRTQYEGWRHHPGYFFSEVGKKYEQDTRLRVSRDAHKRKDSKSRSKSRSEDRTRTTKSDNSRTKKSRVRSESGSPSLNEKKRKKKTSGRQKTESSESDSSSGKSSNESEDEEKEKPKKVQEKPKKSVENQQTSDSSDTSDSDSDSDEEESENEPVKKVPNVEENTPGKETSEKETPEKVTTDKGSVKSVQKPVIATDKSSNSSDDSSDSTSEDSDEEESSKSEEKSSSKKNVHKRQFSEENIRSTDLSYQKYKHKRHDSDEEVHKLDRITKYTKAKREEPIRRRHDTTSEDDSSEDERKKRKQMREKSPRKERNRKKSETSTSDDTSPEDKIAQNKRSFKEKITQKRKEESYQKEKSPERSKRKYSGSGRKEENEKTESKSSTKTADKEKCKSSATTPDMKNKSKSAALVVAYESSSSSSSDDDDDESSDSETSETDSKAPKQKSKSHKEGYASRSLEEDQRSKNHKRGNLSPKSKKSSSSHKPHSSKDYEDEDHANRKDDKCRKDTRVEEEEICHKSNKDKHTKIEGEGHHERRKKDEKSQVDAKEISQKPDKEKLENVEMQEVEQSYLSDKKHRKSSEVEEKEKMKDHQDLRDSDVQKPKISEMEEDRGASAKRSRHSEPSKDKLYDSEDGLFEVDAKRPRKSDIVSPEVDMDKYSKHEKKYHTGSKKTGDKYSNDIFNETDVEPSRSACNQYQDAKDTADRCDKEDDSDRNVKKSREDDSKSYKKRFSDEKLNRPGTNETIEEYQHSFTKSHTHKKDKMAVTGNRDEFSLKPEKKLWHEGNEDIISKKFQEKQKHHQEQSNEDLETSSKSKKKHGDEQKAFEEDYEKFFREIESKQKQQRKDNEKHLGKSQLDEEFGESIIKRYSDESKGNLTDDRSDKEDEDCRKSSKSSKNRRKDHDNDKVDDRCHSIETEQLSKSTGEILQADEHYHREPKSGRRRSDETESHPFKPKHGETDEILAKYVYEKESHLSKTKPDDTDEIPSKIHKKYEKEKHPSKLFAEEDLGRSSVSRRRYCDETKANISEKLLEDDVNFPEFSRFSGRRYSDEGLRKEEMPRHFEESRMESHHSDRYNRQRHSGRNEDFESEISFDSREYHERKLYHKPTQSPEILPDDEYDRPRGSRHRYEEVYERRTTPIGRFDEYGEKRPYDDRKYDYSRDYDPVESYGNKWDGSDNEWESESHRRREYEDVRRREDVEIRSEFSRRERGDWTSDDKRYDGHSRNIDIRPDAYDYLIGRDGRERKVEERTHVEYTRDRREFRDKDESARRSEKYRSRHSEDLSRYLDERPKHRETWSEHVDDRSKQSEENYGSSRRLKLFIDEEPKDPKKVAAEAEIDYYTGKKSRPQEKTKEVEGSSKDFRAYSPSYEQEKKHEYRETGPRLVDTLLSLKTLEKCSSLQKDEKLTSLLQPTSAFCREIESVSPSVKNVHTVSKNLIDVSNVVEAASLQKPRQKFTEFTDISSNIVQASVAPIQVVVGKVSTSQPNPAIVDPSSSLSWLKSYDDLNSESDRDSIKYQSSGKESSKHKTGPGISKLTVTASEKSDPDSCYDEVTSSDSDMKDIFKMTPVETTPKRTLLVNLERLTEDNQNLNERDRVLISPTKVEDKEVVPSFKTEDRVSQSGAKLDMFQLIDIPLPDEEDEPPPPPPPPPPPMVVKQKENTSERGKTMTDAKNPTPTRRSRRISARKSSIDENVSEIKPADNQTSSSAQISEATNSVTTADASVSIPLNADPTKQKISMKFSTKWDKKVGKTAIFDTDNEPSKGKLEKHVFEDVDSSTQIPEISKTNSKAPLEDPSTTGTSAEEQASPPGIKTRRSSRRSAQAAKEALVNLNNNASRRGRGKKAPVADSLTKEEPTDSQPIKSDLGTPSVASTEQIPQPETLVFPVVGVSPLQNPSTSLSFTDIPVAVTGAAVAEATKGKESKEKSLMEKAEEEITEKILQEEMDKKKPKSDWYDRDDDRRDRRDRDRRDDRERREKRSRYDDDRDRDRNYRNYDRDRDYDDRRYRDRDRGRRDRDRDDYYRDRDSRRHSDRDERDSYVRKSRRRYDRDSSYESRSRSPEYTSSRRSTKEDPKPSEDIPKFDPPKKVMPLDIFQSDPHKNINPGAYQTDVVDIPPPQFTPSASYTNITIVPTQAADSSTSPAKPLKVKSRWLRFSEAEATQDTNPHVTLPVVADDPALSVTSGILSSNLVSIVPVETPPTIPPPTAEVPSSNAPVPSTYRPPKPAAPSEPQLPAYIDQLVIDPISPRKNSNIFDILTTIPEPDLESDVSSTAETKADPNFIDSMPESEMAIVTSEMEEIPVKIPYFEPIQDNIYLTERRQSKEMRRLVCDCTTSKEDRDMGVDACGSDCLNRMLYIECGSRCACGEYCTNKRFENNIYSNVEAFQTSWKGFGLRAVEELQSDVFVMEYVGEVLDYKGFKNRSRQYSKENQLHFYFMALNPDVLIDATVKGNISRFMNHSCDPNCETQKWTINGELRIGFFTKRVIAADEELTFNYQFETYGQAAQKCFCGTDKCRGVIGIEKPLPFKTKKKDKIIKKKDDMVGVDDIEEQIERMNIEGLRNRHHVLNLCRLMVYVQQMGHRIAILKILQNTAERACLRLFVDYHGLPLLWSWMADSQEPSKEFKFHVISLLSELPITNRTILQDSKILSVIEKWTDISEADSNVEVPPPPPSSTPIGILSCTKDTKEKILKKRVTFAEEEPSSDSELSDIVNITTSEASSSTTLPSDVLESGSVELSVEGELVHSSAEKVQNLELSDLVQSTADTELNDVKIEADSSVSGTDNEPAIFEADSALVESSDKKDSLVESSATEEESQDDESSSDSNDKSECLSLGSVASKLLEQWSSLKEVFKIPRKERVEERKRTERELDTRYKEIGDSAFSDWTSRRKKKSKKRSAADEELFLDPNRPRRTLLPTPPKMSKEERRQLFEAQVKAQDEMNAEFQRQQLEALQVTYPCVPVEYFQDPGFVQQIEKDPNFALQLHDPNFILQLQDPNFMMQFMDPHSLEQDPTMSAQLAMQLQQEQQMTMMQQDPNLVLQMQQDPSLAMQMQQNPNLAMQMQQDPNLAMQMQQDPNLAMQMQQNPNLAMQMQQDPNFALHLQQNPNLAMQMNHDQNLLSQGAFQHSGMQQQVVDVNGHLIQTGMPPQPDQTVPSQSQMMLDANGQPVRFQPPFQVPTSHGMVQQPQAQYFPIPSQGVVLQTPPTQITSIPQTVQVPDQNLVHQQLQQLINLQQNLAAAVPSASQPIEEDVPPPPSPPKAKQPKLPPNWKTAKDAEGKTYFYHSITRITQWDLPEWDDIDIVPDMDLGTPIIDEFGKKKKKTMTAAADTSSEVEKKLKDYFRKGMSSYIVSCLNPYRKPDCKSGKIISTEDFKHLARKLTHHVMAKELKHCRHVEDLEVNENVKSKAKDYVRKYMSKAGNVYKKPLDDDIY